MSDTKELCKKAVGGDIVHHSGLCTHEEMRVCRTRSFAQTRKDSSQQGAASLQAERFQLSVWPLVIAVSGTEGLPVPMAESHLFETGTFLMA